MAPVMASPMTATIFKGHARSLSRAVSTSTENEGRSALDGGSHALDPHHALYDRREDRVTLDEMVKINIRG